MNPTDPAPGPRKIVLDCDPGLDDAVALLLAHGNPGIDLLAVTTVVGNQTLEKVTRNARIVGTIAGITGVPFAAGCDRPLVRPVQNAPEIHGESGMGRSTGVEPAIELDGRHGVDLIIDTVMSHEAGEVTLVPIGGLTNIAMAVRKEPRIAERVREVVLMGGGYHTGNRTPVAEFNIAIDPEAAHIVFNAGWPVVMVGLDLTHQALATPDVLTAIDRVGSAPARFVRGLMDFSADSHKAAAGSEYPPVHDPCAVAYVIDPAVVATRKAPVDIELQGRLTTGMTVTDLRFPAPDQCRTSVAVELDRERFWGLVVDALERIGEASPREARA